MATTKIWPVRDSLKRVTDYAANPDKTEYDDLRRSISYAANGKKAALPDEKSFLVTGINCDADSVFGQMSAVKEHFGKPSGNVAYHAYQSFKPGEVSPEECHQIGVELAEKLWGSRYQVLVATHLDKEHLHNHFIINSVSFVDGKKFNDNKAAYRSLRETSDDLCRQRGLSVIEKPRGKTPRQIYFAEKSGAPTKYELIRQAIDDAIAVSSNQAMFEAALKREGYVIRMDPNRKYPVIRSIYGGRSTRLYHLGEDYEPLRIISRVYENDSRIWPDYHAFMRNTGLTIHPAQTCIRAHRPRRKVTGLFALYLHYLYLLGYRPKRDHYQPLTPEMKAALRKCDEYSRHASLLAREHLNTEEDVLKLIEGTETRLTSLCMERNKIYNQLRRTTNPERTADLRQKRSELTETIKGLRQDRKTAGQILDRAQQIREDTAREYDAQKQLRSRCRGRKEARDR